MASEMHATVRGWILSILTRRPDVVSLAMRERSKFEGWLKFELGAVAQANGMKSVVVESSREQVQSRADLGFIAGEDHWQVELKTPNTNWRMEGVATKTRPITKNITSIISDARKLAGAGGRGLVAFVLFPVPTGDNRWQRYLGRISESLGIRLSEEGHCTRAVVPLCGEHACEAIVCCFEYPA